MVASIKKRSIPSAFYELGLQYLFLNLPNIKHIASLYNRSKAYLAGILKMIMEKASSIRYLRA
jgi:hypothetical protein